MDELLIRKRRLRKSPGLRAMTAETRLQVENLIAPFFVKEGTGADELIPNMPGQFRCSIGSLVDRCRRIHALGIPAVLLFGIPDQKDECGSSAYDPDGIIQRAVRALKKDVPGLVVITDVCMCEYTSHGHCGLLSGDTVDNDATLPLLARIAVSHAEAGADIVAPSDMMDGRVIHIRRALDAAGHKDTAILSYASKFASGFYGPFRDAAGSAPSFGDRKAYQMNPANPREALHEALLDVDEGADMLIVKPALPYLDIIHAVRAKTLLPLAAYQVSGEYAMILAAVEKGILDRDRAIMETLTAIKRAGADMIITYFAEEATALIRKGVTP
ncbi:MAG: porphobilinogen synthase [Clostridia bacterium]